MVLAAGQCASEIEAATSNRHDLAIWHESNLNGDGQVTGADYTLWADNYTVLPASPMAPVPEPRGALLVLTAAPLIAWLVRSHRRRA